MFFATKLGPKIGNTTRALSRVIPISVSMYWEALGRVIDYLKGVKVKGILCAKPKLY